MAGATAPRWPVLAVIAATIVLLAVSVLTRPINHDESQYVAATALMRHGLPYRDFAYLQTPLQPLVLSPLAFVSAGWLLAASRVANALFAFAALAALLLAVRGQAPRWAALTAAAALICTDLFLFAGALARNDALPMACLAAAVALLVKAIEAPAGWKYLIGGLCLGLATSAKISFAFPAAGAGLFLLIQARRIGWRPFLLAAGGGLAGLLPVLVLWPLAPDAFQFGVIDYSLRAPQQWWASIGRADYLEPSSKLLRLAGYAVLGSIFVALTVVVADRRKNPVSLLLDMMIVAGLISAYLPDPAFRQYLVPLVPPLFARFALALGRLEGMERRVALAATAIAGFVGLAPTADNIAESLVQGPELVAAVEQGIAVASLVGDGTVATLAGERAAGFDVALHPAFVTGPFLFRTHGSLSADAARLGRSITWQRLAPLDLARPEAVLVGGEHHARPPFHPRGLDFHLVKWAQARGYRPHRLPGKGFTLWLEPKAATKLVGKVLQLPKTLGARKAR